MRPSIAAAAARVQQTPCPHLHYAQHRPLGITSRSHGLKDEVLAGWTEAQRRGGLPGHKIAAPKPSQSRTAAHSVHTHIADPSAGRVVHRYGAPVRCPCAAAAAQLLPDPLRRKCLTGGAVKHSIPSLSEADGSYCALAGLWRQTERSQLACTLWHVQWVHLHPPSRAGPRWLH